MRRNCCGLLWLAVLCWSGCGWAAEQNAAAEQLALLLSRQQVAVQQDIRWYLDDAEAYKTKYRAHFLAQDIEPDTLDLLAVLKDTLLRHQALVYVDWKAHAPDVFVMLDRIAGAQLAGLPQCQAFRADAARHAFGIHYYLAGEDKRQLLFQCCRAAGLRLLALDDGSDAYALVLVNPQHSAAIAQYAANVGITLVQWPHSD